MPRFRSAVLFLLASSALALPPETEFRLTHQINSLTGSHRIYKRFLENAEIVGADLVLSSSGDNGADKQPEPSLRVASQRATSPAAAIGSLLRRFPELKVERAEPIWLRSPEGLRGGWRIVAAESRLERFAYYLDSASLDVVTIIPLFFNGVPARLFQANPVTLLNTPALQDNNNSATAVPDSAYSTVELPDTVVGGPLIGPNVTITDLESPKTQPVDTGQPLNFDRSNAGFEEVMAYYHLDRSQRHLQSLGYTGERKIIARSIKVDAHGAAGEDNSYYAINAQGEGMLYFGDGGVDDAEDPDILLHEYGHAIHEAISPGAFFGSYGSQARALGEGFGDYWAFSTGYEASRASGRDAFCVGDWDARCASGPSSSCGYGPSADCLRRVDGTKTMDQYAGSEQRGNEHRNGEIWSSALREIFVKFVERDGVTEGRRNADRLVIESMFGLPPSTNFFAVAKRMIQADQLLYGGTHAADICAAMVDRKIFSSWDCTNAPRGEVTMFPAASNGTIPDAEPAGIILAKQINDDRPIERLQVRVSITHAFRGDLRLSLIGPDGTTVLLQSNSNDSRTDLRTTYGGDTPPQQSFEAFRGKSARGLWQLQVSDVARGDTGRLDSWAILIQFQGDASIVDRAIAAGSTRSIAPVTHSDDYHTDLHLFNRGTTEARIIAFFTPRNTNGMDRFAAIRIVIPPRQLVALDNVIFQDFQTAGLGNIEVRGDVGDLLISARSSHDTQAALRRDTVPVFSQEDAIGVTERLFVPHLKNDGIVKSEVGITETAGAPGVIELTVRDQQGNASAPTAYPISPFSQIHVPVFSGITPVHGYAEIRVISGGARVIGFAVVRDGLSHDSYFVPGIRSRPGREWHVVPAIRAVGFGGTAWHTELALSNIGSASQTTELIFRTEHGTAVRQQTLAQHSSSSADDVIGSLFAGTEQVGMLFIRATDPGSFLVSSRTWTSSASGGLGQLVIARSVEESIGRGATAVEALHLENSGASRTNLGVLEVTGSPITVRIRVFDNNGTMLLVRDQFIGGYTCTQFNVSHAGSPDFATGRATFEVIEGNGRILAYASIVNNTTGDPVYIPAQ